MISIVNEQALHALLKEKLNQDMLAAAEPIIQKALADIEHEMRRAIVPRLVSMIEANVDLYRDNRDLVIRIRQADGKAT